MNGAPSAHDIEYARSRIGARATAAQIARFIGCSETTVKLSVTRREASNEEWLRDREQRRQNMLSRKFAGMWIAGRPLKEIQDETGLSDTGIARLREDLGLQPRTKRDAGMWWGRDQDRLLERAYITEGRSASEVAKALGITRNAVIGRASRLGLKRPTVEGQQ